MTRRTGVLTSVCAAAVLVAGGLAGCSGGSGGTASTAPAASGASASAAASAPAETNWAQAKASGLRFAVPENWKVFDATAVTQGKDKELVKELTQTYGVDASQLAEIFGQMDLMVVGPIEQKFAPNVNVVPNDLTELPPATDLATQLKNAGATTGTPRDETTPLGPAIVVPYELTSGTNQVKGRSIVLEGPNGFVTVTVSHITDAGADAVASSVLSTISPGSPPADP